MNLEERYPVPSAPVWRTTVTPAAIHGGDANNRVPSECVLQLDIRHVPEESPEEITAAIQACFEGSEVLVMHTGSVLETAEDDAHVQRLAALVSRIGGMQPEFRNEHFGSDARFYSQAGIPAICFGPAGAGLHSHEEWVDIASLEQFYRVIRELAQSY